MLPVVAEDVDMTQEVKKRRRRDSIVCRALIIKSGSLRAHNLLMCVFAGTRKEA